MRKYKATFTYEVEVEFEFELDETAVPREDGDVEGLWESDVDLAADDVAVELSLKTDLNKGVVTNTGFSVERVPTEPSA